MGVGTQSDTLYGMSRNLQWQPTGAEKDLQKQYGHGGLESVYGGGKLSNPDLMLMFMNPTARNVSTVPTWEGIRTPWIGTRHTWKLLSTLGLIDADIAKKFVALKPEEWNASAAERLYTHVADRGLYITNLAKCTQADARHLPDTVFRAYLPHTYGEIAVVRPKKIIAFGNQVSSVLLQKPISVSAYTQKEFEDLSIGGDTFEVYPTYYPVGQGQRNMPKAIERITAVIRDERRNRTGANKVKNGGRNRTLANTGRKRRFVHGPGNTVVTPGTSTGPH